MRPRILTLKTLARDADRVEIVRRLAGLRSDGRRRFGRLSAHGAVCHLSDSLRMALGERTVSRAPSVLPRALVRWIALYLPLPWPPGIRTRPEVDPAATGTPPDDFARDVAALERLLERVVEQPPDFPWPEHPVFGAISARAWLRWGYLHADHHLRQFGV